MGSEIFRTCPDRPWDPPSHLYNGYRVFPWGKERPGRDADPSPPSNAVGHERVELYLYFPYGPCGLYRASVPVQGCTLPLPYLVKKSVLLLKYFYDENSVIKLWLNYNTNVEHRKQGKPRMRWLHCIKEATDLRLEDLREAIQDRKRWRTLVEEKTRNRERTNVK